MTNELNYQDLLDMKERLIISLLCKYFDFTKEEILKYKDLFEFSNSSLYHNKKISWDVDLVEQLADRINFGRLSSCSGLKLDVHFFRKYAARFKDCILHQNIINWSDELIDEFGDLFDFGKKSSRVYNPRGGFSFPLKANAIQLKILHKYKKKTNWGRASKFFEFNDFEKEYKAFESFWEWDSLSLNQTIPVSLEFIRKYGGQINFKRLSQNPSYIEFIFKNPEIEWSWEGVAGNPALIYDKENCEFLFDQFKKKVVPVLGEKVHDSLKDYYIESHDERTLNLLITVAFAGCPNGQDNRLGFFLGKEFDKYHVSAAEYFTDITLPKSILEKCKSKINFNKAFNQANEELITSEFILDNIEYFDTKSIFASELPIGLDQLKQTGFIPNFIQHSRWLNHNWTWDYIFKNKDDLSDTALAQNKSIYNSLIEDVYTRAEILELLDSYLEEL